MYHTKKFKFTTVIYKKLYTGREMFSGASL